MKRLFNMHFIIISALILILPGPETVSAQQNSIGKLLGLTVTGNTTSEDLVLKLSSGLREGEDLTWDGIQSAIRQLWALGLFADIRLVSERTTSEGIYLELQVVEYPRLDETIIDGAKKIKKEDVEKELGLFRGQVLNPAQITKTRKRLLEQYAEKGFTLAEVTITEEDSEKPGKKILKIEIDEGKKVQVERIQFFNNIVFEDKKLKKQMKETKENRWYRGADFTKADYEGDKVKILEFYRNNGYRDAEIVKDSIYYDAEREDMFIDIWVNEGQSYYIGDITWEGNELFDEEHLASLLEFKKGDAFSQEKFDKSIQEKIGGAYYDFGHIYSQINPRETLRDKDTLDIQFIINEGNPVEIRKIRISGNTRTKDRVIRRQLRILPGDVFNRELLMRSHRELMMLNYFANVVPDVVPIDEEELDLSFVVEEKSTDTAQLSAGWSEVDRLIGSIGLGMNNLLGNGQQLTLNWNFGRFYRSFNLGFTEPWLMNTPTLVGVNVYDTKRDPFYIGYRQKSQGASLRLGRRFRWPDNYFRGDWIYRFDRTHLSDFNNFYQDLNPNNIVNEYADGPLTSSGIMQIITRNSLDHPEFPTHGSKVTLSTEFVGGIFGGNVGFHKHIFSAEFFTPTISPKLVLLARAQVGYMEALSASRRISFLDYFFMGGTGLSRSIPLRGYDDPLAGGRYYGEGGKTMLQTTIELRFPVITNPMAFGLIFIEAGNTWIDLKHTDPFDLRRSIGIGARIFMPMVGLLGFDYAYGFDHIDEATGRRYGTWKPQFVFGKSF